MRRLVDIEKEIKVLVKTDVTDPKLFDLIRELCILWLYRNQKCNSYADAEEIGTILAEFLYLRLYEPDKQQVHSWIGYIANSYQYAIKEWRKTQASEIIETKGNEKLEKAVLQMCAGSTIDNEDISKMYSWGYLNNLSGVINSVMGGYLNAKISLLLSIQNDRLVCFGLGEADAMYLRMLYRVLCDRLMVELKPEIKDDSLTLLQDFILEDYIEELE